MRRDCFVCGVDEEKVQDGQPDVLIFLYPLDSAPEHVNHCEASRHCVSINGRIKSEIVSVTAVFAKRNKSCQKRRH